MNVCLSTASHRFLSAFSGLTVLFTLSITGCGGGGTTASSPVSDTRAATISTVQGARKVARIIGTTSATRAESSVVVGSGPVVSSLTPMLDTLRRIVRPLSFIGRPVSRDAQTATFDSSLGLYRVDTVEDSRVVAQYFEDSAKSHPVGTTEATVEGGNRIMVHFDINGGVQPVVGDLKINFGDGSAQSGTIDGELQNPKTGREIALKMQFSGDVMRGDAVISSAGTVRLSRVISYGDGRLEADVNYAGSSGHLSQQADLSGSLLLNEKAGKMSAEYNASGAGTLELADGSTVMVSSFDTGI